MEPHTEEIRSVVEKILPDGEVRLSCLESFAESINEAHLCGPQKWGVYFTSEKVRLLVGNLIVCTIHENALWLSLDAHSFDTSSEIHTLLEKSKAWDWESGKYAVYRQVASRNGYFRPYRASSEVKQLIADLHFEFVRNVSNKYKRLRKDSQANYTPSVITYLRRALGHSVPEPEYASAMKQDNETGKKTEHFKRQRDNPEQPQRETVVQSRIGQNLFRKRLIRYWSSECAVTGCSARSLLRASHTKPWRKSTRHEKYDVYNGLLLTPNLDCAFDRGFITFSTDGEIAISKILTDQDINALGLHRGMKLRSVTKRHTPYLEYHREEEFE